jgi:hypothetical protein
MFFALRVVNSQLLDIKIILFIQILLRKSLVHLLILKVNVSLLPLCTLLDYLRKEKINIQRVSALIISHLNFKLQNYVKTNSGTLSTFEPFDSFKYLCGL